MLLLRVHALCFLHYWVTVVVCWSAPYYYNNPYTSSENWNIASWLRSVMLVLEVVLPQERWSVQFSFPCYFKIGNSVSVILSFYRERW